MELQIEPEFGYVVLVGVGTWLLNMGLGIRVGMARKKYDVKYPAMYSDKHQVFNCIQRAHQNTLENIPLFLMLLVFGGLIYPRLSAVCGAVYLVSRVAYAKGYYTGDPAKRNRGAFGYIGMMTLVVISVLFGLRLLGWF